MDKLIIEVRVNEYAMRDANPKVPWTPEEIGRDARAAQDAGASVVHFHARRPDGAPAHGIDDYAAAIRAIRANSDLLINPTLGRSRGAARSSGSPTSRRSRAIRCCSRDRRARSRLDQHRRVSMRPPAAS